MRVLWPVLTARTWLAALLSLDLLVTVSAIKCLQCMSLKNRECESGHMAAVDCPAKDRYCIKYTGDSDNFVFRACSEIEKKQCERREVVPGITMHVCFHTCYTDGCNPAMTVTSLPAAILLAIALASLALSATLAAL
ncbi:U-scoloptoxin(05)-Er3a-like [Littorina saxatilis]|uniref:U-scoloptoxin(05)-Er3a-like n=1 Tax=Littorina saxatilis TaxID=31220 RepID=UPI0038B45AEF